ANTAVQPTALSFAALTCPPLRVTRSSTAPDLDGPALRRRGPSCRRHPRRLSRQTVGLAGLPVQKRNTGRPAAAGNGSELERRPEERVEREGGGEPVGAEGWAHLDFSGDGEVRVHQVLDAAAEQQRDVEGAEVAKGEEEREVERRVQRQDL